MDDIGKKISELRGNERVARNGIAPCEDFGRRERGRVAEQRAADERAVIGEAGDGGVAEVAVEWDKDGFAGGVASMRAAKKTERAG